MREPLVSVTLPVDRYVGVARLVTAGVGSRLDLPFEIVDDLQLAVELIIDAAFAHGRQATVAFTNEGSELMISISPIESRILDATRAGFDTAAPVSLRDLLEKLVDSVATTAGPTPGITLRKSLEAVRL